MREEYDFSNAKRAQEVPHLAKLQRQASSGKTGMILTLDDDVLAAVRARAADDGKECDVWINEVLRAATAPGSAPLTVDILRRVLREELHAA